MDSVETLARQNRLLNAIPKSELEHLLPHMERLSLFPRQVLYRQGTAVEYVHFPVTGVLSMIASTHDGETVEVASVGSEGFTEVHLVLSVSCNRLHSLEQRCARWLMSCVDRSQYEEIAVTQELLAEMLGVRRQSVDHVLGDLECQQMIECLRGSIKINAQKRLCQVGCKCDHLGKEGLDSFVD